MFLGRCRYYREELSGCFRPDRHDWCLISQYVRGATIWKPNSPGRSTSFDVLVRLDTPVEVDYYRHGGILPYVLRDLAKGR